MQEKVILDGKDITLVGTVHVSPESVQEVRETIERVGAESFSRASLVQTANSWALQAQGLDDFNDFTDTKRFSQNYYGIYEIQVPEDESMPSWQYIIRVDPEWLPSVNKP